MADTGIKWDADKFKARMDKLAAAYPTATEKAAAGIGQQVIWDAINEAPTVPVLTGNLRSSGAYEVFPGGLSWRSVKLYVGFNTPYAARVHQIPMNFNTARAPGAGNYFLSAKLDRHRTEYVKAWGRKTASLLGMA